MKLISRKKLLWKSIEQLFAWIYEPLILYWEEMKAKLYEKYLPQFYQVKLPNQWNSLRQRNMPVSDYMAQFDEYMMKCSILNDETITLRMQ